MALTIRNTNTLALLNILNKNTAAQSNTLKQLTTGLRINSGKDDPAGLIALSSLNSELTRIRTSLTNNQRTDSILTVADSSIAEISNLLGEIERLVVASSSDANLTASEIAANQSQIDDALAAIDRVVSTTNFNGKKLLDGAFSIVKSGIDATRVTGLRVFSRSQSTSNQLLTVQRVASAQLASVALQADQAANKSLTTSGSTQLTIAGSLGTANITLVGGLTQSGIVTAINAATAQTGITAVLSSTTAGTVDIKGIRLDSTTFGSDAFVSVDVLSGGVINEPTGTAGVTNAADDFKASTKTVGVDANITINGQTAGTDGLDVSFSANGMSLEFTLSTNFGSGVLVAGQTQAQQEQTTFTVQASGGATFQLGTTSSTRATIGIDSLASYNLGGGNGTSLLSELKSGGAADLKSNAAAALNTVREAMSEVAGVRGRLGGFQKFQVGSAINALNAAEIGLSEAASVIGDTDFAIATAALNQQTVLVQTSIALLGVANQQAAQILSLLG